jgi:choline kinase
MHGVILAAGNGSRMGEHTTDVPKAFIEIEGQTLYERQRAVLEPYVDAVTVVLGYQHETVIERFGPSRNIVVDRWDETDNAESLYQALTRMDDDVAVLNGDVVVTPEAVKRLVGTYRGNDENAVAYLPGIQTDHTAIRLDDGGQVTDYGEVPGQRHAGLGIIDSTFADDAIEHLQDHRTEWYPSLYSVVPTVGVSIDPGQHLEINRPRDRQVAERRLPLRSG